MNEERASCGTSGDAVLDMIATRSGVAVAAHLQVADRCNHVCVHCYQVQGQKGELSLEELRGVLASMARAGVLLLNISGGEATLRGDLPEIIDAAATHGFAIRLYTNAYRLSDAVLDALVRARALEVHVSVYSDIESEHDAVTRVPGSLAATLANVRRIRAAGLRVVLKTPALRQAPGAFARVGALARELGCEYEPSTDITAREDGDVDSIAHALTGAELLASGQIEPWLPSARDDEERASKLSGNSCGVCSSAVVLPNGDVLPCSDTPVVLGNVRSQSLADIYRVSDDAKMLRNLRWSDVHGCRDCDLLLACHRCHAIGLQQAGDYLGPYALACERARARYSAGLGRAVEVRMAEGRPASESRSVTPTGPYRIAAEGVLTAVDDEPTATDIDLARRHAWLRRESMIPPENLIRRRPLDSSPQCENAPRAPHGRHAETR
jgi:AdoMet-dependent heme synthase